MSDDNDRLNPIDKLFNPARGRKSRKLWKKSHSFSLSEAWRICNIIKKQSASPGSFIDINGVVLPKIGHIFELKEGTRYTFLPPGSKCLVTKVQIQKVFFTDQDFVPEAKVMPLNSAAQAIEPREYSVRIKDLKAVSEDTYRLFVKNRESNFSPEEIIFNEGDAVELTGDTTIKMESPMMGAASHAFPKGLKGVIDSPKGREGANLNQINSPYQLANKTGVNVELSLAYGKRPLVRQRDVFEVPLVPGQRYNVYLPSYQHNVEFSSSQIRRRQFDRKMFDRIVMDEKTRKEILSLVYSEEKILSQWGLGKVFHRGRGKIFLAIGPSGTGKTMTGEALAELLGRPLFIADSTNLIPIAGHFEQALKEVIDKTERWNAVTIIDEAEGILLSREATSYDVSWRIQAVLRNLERLERGILWLTTNRPIDIDPAINSRIRCQICFPALDDEKRKKVWQGIFSENLSVSGLTEKILCELVKFEINGREIKNAVINAADRASYDHLDSVPVEYVLAAAKTICESQEILEKAKKDYYNHRRDNSIGFLRD
ncbi:MAG: AAA family ATPase [Candidatus Nealsonbacteria bacterium]|nr:AAA family ATPase [Candidatus Nealsonbacteria bacterium]